LRFKLPAVAVSSPLPESAPYTHEEEVMVEAVIFDIDGTLIDSVYFHAKAWQEALRHFGHDLPFERVRHEIGKGGDILMRDLLPRSVVDEREEEIATYRAGLFKRKYLSEIRGFSGVRALFERIRADGKKIALASSAKGDEIAHYRKIADIDGLTDAETSSDDAEQSKPHPDIFEAALDRLGGIDPSCVIVVGDTPHDADAASKAKLRIIGVLCGGFPEDELRAAGCFEIYRDPAQLLSEYEKSPIR
jgi:HAD superfamily hydrolase (TIGR01549 family)